MKAYFLSSLLMLSLATATLAQEVRVPFLFTEDEKLLQAKLAEVIPRSNAIQSSEYLNAPMTRLEYLLTKLNDHLDGELKEGLVRGKISDGFERRRVRSLETPVSIKSFSRYKREVGRIIVGYRIEGLGRPKMPMRTTCDEILFALDISAPQENLGFLYHNTILGVLAQEDLAMYTPALETLANNIVHKVILVSNTEDSGTNHALICQRTEKGAPILYERHSFKLH